MSAVAAPPLPVAPRTPPAPVAPAPVAPRPWRWTVEQVQELDALGYFRDRKVQLIHGEIIDMSLPGRRHVKGVMATTNVMRRVFLAGAHVAEEKPFRAGDSLVAPDVAVIPGGPEDFPDHPTVALLLVEVADSSLTLDVTTKAELYATAGVADYWVVDVDGRKLLVFRDPKPLPDGGSAYRSRQEFGPGEAVALLAAPASAVAVADLLP